MLTLPELKRIIDQMAGRIGAPESRLPTYGSTEDGARPHLEADDQQYHYVVVERGQELERRSTRDLDELLETVFLDVTSGLGFAYELAHRVEGQDCRRIGFQRQIDLLVILSPAWAEREVQRHHEILRRHPFDDSSSIRARFCKSLQDQGHPPPEAWSKACERYPLPEDAA